MRKALWPLAVVALVVSLATVSNHQPDQASVTPAELAAREEIRRTIRILEGLDNTGNPADVAAAYRAYHAAIEQLRRLNPLPGEPHDF